MEPSSKFRPSPSILVVDDEPLMQDVLHRLLCAQGYAVATAATGEEAVAQLEERDFDVVLSDIVMPGLDGLAVLDRCRSLNPRAAVILMTAYATVDSAIAALRSGASDYLEKPFLSEDLTRCVERALHYRDVLWKERLSRRMVHPPLPEFSLVGDSPAIRAVREQIALIAPKPSNVLITGESGVGKELAARAIHDASGRSRRAFVAVNCGAIPDTLLESQLFGHVRGAFTTAVHANPGLFAVADEGTLFLDEIGELPFALQVKLLRVIEERQVWPVGAAKRVPVDVRIVASTNRDLVREIEGGRFREDLFYRLNVVHLKLPPLRDRRSDIALLADHLRERLNAKLGTRFLGIERDALRVLMDQPWKGNVRELENVLERAMVLGDGSGDMITLVDIPQLTGLDAERPVHLREAVGRFERRHVLDVLAEAGGDKREAARRLGISLASLYRKLSSDSEPPARPAA
ncbi:MAG TPA: sigma-54 dependent transcriptional regulator [Methylomirabilota bacterium]|jgi:DNA-binding NtrC family response regulator